MFDAILNALVSTPAYDLGARAGATFLMLDRLEKLGLVFSPSVCEFHARGCDLDAYAISSDGKSASLYVTVLHDERNWKRIEDLIRGAIKMFQVVSQVLSPEMAAIPEVSLFSERASKLRDGFETLSINVLAVGEPITRKFADIQLANATVTISTIDTDTLFGSESYDACRLAFRRPKDALAAKSVGGCLTFLLTMDAAEVGRLYAQYCDALVDSDIRALITFNPGLIREIKKAIQKTPELVLVGNRGVTFLADKVEATGSSGCVAISSADGLRLTDGYQTVVAASEAIAKKQNKNTGALLAVKIVVQPPAGDANVSRLTALQLHRQGKGCAQDPYGVDPVIVRLAHAFSALSSDLQGRSGTSVIFKNFKKAQIVSSPEDIVITKEEIARAFNATSGILDSAQWNDTKNLKVFVSRMYADDVVIDKGRAAQLVGRVILLRRAREVLPPGNDRAVVNALAAIGSLGDYDWTALCKQRKTSPNDDALIMRSSEEFVANVSNDKWVSVSPRVRVQVAKVPAKRWFSLLSWARKNGQFTVAERSSIFRAALACRFAGTCDIHTAARAWTLLQNGVRQGFRVRG